MASIGAVVTLFCGGTAQAGDVDLYGRVEPTLAIPLAAPQTDRFNRGFQGIVDGGVKLEWIDLKLTAQLLTLTDKGTDASHEAAVTGAFGGGVRLRAPDRLLPTGSPWLDADLLYVRAASLNRFGYSIAVGVNFKTDKVPWLHFAPVVRFAQILDTDQIHFDDRDAYLLSFGLSVEFDQRTATPAAHSETAAVQR